MRRSGPTHSPSPRRLELVRGDESAGCGTVSPRAETSSARGPQRRPVELSEILQFCDILERLVADTGHDRKLAAGQWFFLLEWPDGEVPRVRLEARQEPPMEDGSWLPF